METFNVQRDVLACLELGLLRQRWDQERSWTCVLSAACLADDALELVLHQQVRVQAYDGRIAQKVCQDFSEISP